jgi:hypothetical protein
MQPLIFNQEVQKYISKHKPILDIPKNSLCPELFSFTDFNPPAMLESARMQILRDVEQIAPYVIVRDFYATGMAFVPSDEPSKTADIHINIEFSDNKNDTISYSKAVYVAKKLSGHLIPGTRHKVIYRLFSKPVDTRVLLAKYDVLNNKWIKIPSSK